MAEKQVTFQFKNVQLFKDHQALGINLDLMELSVKQNVMISSVLLKHHSTLFDLTALQQIAPPKRAQIAN